MCVGADMQISLQYFYFGLTKRNKKKKSIGIYFSGGEEARRTSSVVPKGGLQLKRLKTRWYVGGGDGVGGCGVCVHLSVRAS